MPRCLRQAALARPAGPAPTIRTGSSAVVAPAPVDIDPRSCQRPRSSQPFSRVDSEALPAPGSTVARTRLPCREVEALVIFIRWRARGTRSRRCVHLAKVSVVRDLMSRADPGRMKCIAEPADLPEPDDGNESRVARVQV